MLTATAALTQLLCDVRDCKPESHRTTGAIHQSQAYEKVEKLILEKLVEIQASREIPADVRAVLG